MIFKKAQLKTIGTILWDIITSPVLSLYASAKTMVNLIKQNFLLILTYFFVIASFSTTPEYLLKLAQAKIAAYENISYDQEAIYPNPMGTTDSFHSSITFSKNEKCVTGYDFIFQGSNKDEVCIDGVYKSVDHSKKITNFFPSDEPKKLEGYISGIRDMQYSPLTFLKAKDWKYVCDTTINNAKLRNYFRVEKDTILYGNKVYTEQHIFVNQESKLLEKWARKNYFKGNLSQTIVYNYSNYKLDKDRTLLSYNFPKDYTSELFGSSKEPTLIEVGEEAPSFSIKDIHDNPLDLAELKSKKVILNFSSVGCGHSVDAMDYINENEILRSAEYTPIFLSIWDKEAEVNHYFKNLDTEFRVISNADKLAERYGVSTTPTFIVIDEEGKIEEAIKGFDREFLMTLKK